ELPQVFETADLLTAHASLNLMKPRLTQPQFFDSAKVDPAVIVVKGVSTNVRANDGVLVKFKVITEDGKDQDVDPTFYKAFGVAPEPQLDRTTLKLRLFVSDSTLGAATVQAQPLESEQSAVLAISAKYQKIEAFGLADRSKTVQSIQASLSELSTSLATA